MTTLAVCGKLGQQFKRSPSKARTPIKPPTNPSTVASTESASSRASAFHPIARKNPDLPGTLKHRHGHGVRDAQNAHQQGDAGGPQATAWASPTNWLLAARSAAGTAQAPAMLSRFPPGRASGSFPAIRPQDAALAVHGMLSPCPEGRKFLHFVQRQDNRPGLERRDAVIDALNPEASPLDIQPVANMYVQTLGQKVAQKDFRLRHERVPRTEVKRAELIGVRLPSIRNRIYLGSQIHDVHDHRADLRHFRQAGEPGSICLIDRGIQKRLLHDGYVGPGALVHAQPLRLKRARKTDQCNKCRYGQAYPEKGQYRADAPSPQISPCELRK